MASTALYPDMDSKAGFTYSMTPLQSVISIESAVCSTA